MENRIYLQPAYILHKQEFRNTSLLLDLFCLDYGRVRAVARGARRAKSRYRPLLQVFQPLLVSLSGKGEVKTVGVVESSVSAIALRGERMFSGFYLNELVTRILISHAEHTNLYNAYQQALLELQHHDDLHTVLRRFEMSLLQDLGYGFDLEKDCVSRQPIMQTANYLFVPDHGFEKVVDGNSIDPNTVPVFTGRHILELGKLEFTSDDSRQSAKQILRLALQAHLGGKPLHSRDLFRRRA